RRARSTEARRDCCACLRLYTCYFPIVSAKSAVLAAAAFAVVALAVYLFIQARPSPAPVIADVAPRPSRTEAPPAPSEPKTKSSPTRSVLARAARLDDSSPTRRVPQMGTEIDGPPELTPEDERRPNLKKDNLMELANKAYDRQDFD